MEIEDESSTKTNKKEVSSKVGPRLSRRERVFLFVANIAIITILISDLLYFLGMVQETKLPLLASGNLGVLVLAYFSYILKRRIRRRMLEAEGNKEADQASQDEGRKVA